MENPDGKKGEAAQANFGRKGSPARGLKAGESFTLAPAEKTSGAVRRIWVTIHHPPPPPPPPPPLRMYGDRSEKHAH